MSKVVLFGATTMAQCFGALGGLALASVLAQMAGPSLLGSFTVMLSILGVLSMLSRRGQGSLLTRAVAWALHAEGSAAAVTLLVLAVRRIVLPSLILGVVGSVLLWSGIFGQPFPGSLVAFPFALVLTTALALFAGYARGSERPWAAPMFELGGISMLTVGLLTLALVAMTDVTPLTVTAIFLISMLCMIGISVIVISRDLPDGSGLLHPSNDHRRELQHGQIPFTLIAIASFLVQSGSFLIAAPFLAQADLGLLRAAERLALLVSFPVLAITPLIVPQVVRFARLGDATGLRRTLMGAMGASGVIGASVLLLLLFWPARALALMGEEFIEAVPYLQIMAVAQFVVAVISPLIGFLHSAGHERLSMWINLGALALALGLIPILCTVFGALGFALAYSAVIIVRFGLIGLTVALRATPLPVHKGVTP